MATRFTSLATKLGLTVGGILTLGTITYTLVTQDSGTTVTVTSSPQIYSGSTFPLHGTLTFSEVDGYASGSISIRNPLDETLYCREPLVDITTNSSPALRYDAFTATGSIGQIGKNITGSTLLANNLTSATGIKTFTGSTTAATAIGGTDGQHTFKLAPYSSTTSNNTINITSSAQTGSGLVGKYHVECWLGS